VRYAAAADVTDTTDATDATDASGGGVPVHYAAEGSEGSAARGRRSEAYTRPLFCST